MAIFIAIVVFSPNISSALHKCQSHSESVSFHTSLNADDNEQADSHEDHDCSCPSHRVHCCHYQATASDPKLNFGSVYFDIVYTQDLFILPASPLLEGPFQPPRA